MDRALRRRIGWDGTLLLGIVVGAVLMSWISPPLTPPDETAHLLYPREILVEHHLPILTRTSDAWENHQPPLYYLIATPVVWASRDLSFAGQIHFNRLTSVMLFAAAGWMLLKIGRKLWPQNLWSRLAMLSVLFLPMPLYAGASVSNDVFVLTIASALWCSWLLRPSKLTTKSAIGLGSILAAGLLTKVTLYPMLAVVGVALLWRQSVKYWLIAGATVVIGSGWWFVQNIIRVGDLLGLQYAVGYFRGQHEDLSSISLLGKLIGKTAAGFIGVFDKQDLWLPWVVYILIGGVIVISVYRAQHLAGNTIAWLAVLASAVGFIIVNNQIFQPQGRYLIMLIPIVGWWLGRAAASWSSRSPILVSSWLIVLGMVVGYSLLLLARQPVAAAMQYPRTIDVAAQLHADQPTQFTYVDGQYQAMSPAKFVFSGNLIDTQHHPTLHIEFANSEPVHVKVEWRIAGQRWFESSRQLETTITKQAELAIPEQTSTALLSLRISLLENAKEVVFNTLMLSAR